MIEKKVARNAQEVMKRFAPFCGAMIHLVILHVDPVVLPSQRLHELHHIFLSSASPLGCRNVGFAKIEDAVEETG